MKRKENLYFLVERGNYRFYKGVVLCFNEIFVFFFYKEKLGGKSKFMFFFWRVIYRNKV